ncbi:MAG: DUF3343 domain-containing protein [Clostridia bacterium]|nr:DUF3343 domain-containing protein [Clostridia bacterium]
MHKICTASIGSLTHAMKGQKLLTGEGISSRIVKLDSKKTRRGCAYGIEFSCDEQRRVRSVLGASHLPVSDYFSGGGGELL